MARIVPELVAEQFEDEGEARPVPGRCKTCPRIILPSFTNTSFADAVTGAKLSGRRIWSSSIPLRGWLLFSRRCTWARWGFQRALVHEYSQGRDHREMGHGTLWRRLVPLPMPSPASTGEKRTGWNFPLSFDIGPVLSQLHKVSRVWRRQLSSPATSFWAGPGRVPCRQSGGGSSPPCPGRGATPGL